MKLGFVSAILADQPFEALIDIAAAEGFACVEALCWPAGKAERRYAGVTHIDVTNLTQGRADSVNALCRDRGVDLSALGYYPNILAADPQESAHCIEHLKKVIQAARLLGLSTVNTFIGADHRRNIEENLSSFEKTWPDIIRLAEGEGIRIAIENCPMLFSFDEWPGGKNLAYSPAIWRRMFEYIPSASFGLNYDPSHFIWQFIDYIRPIHEFRDRIFHVHAKDLKIDRARLADEGILSLGWSTPKIPGYGAVDWGAFFSALSDIAYDGPVCVEVEDRSFEDSLEARIHSLRISKKILSPYL